MMQRAYVSFYMLCKKKLSMLAVFTCFLILDKIQDGNHVWWRYRPPTAPPPIKYISSCWEDQFLSNEGKIVSKYCNISKKSGDGFHQPPYTTVGYDFPCTSEGLHWLGMTTSAVILHLTKAFHTVSHTILGSLITEDRDGNEKGKKATKKSRKGHLEFSLRGNTWLNDWNNGMQLGWTFYIKWLS